jgi:tetratricopeptide (TPR) repeat protein
MLPTESARSKVFIGCSHKDREWLERLQTHLNDLQYRGFVDVWEDTRIYSGSNWLEEVKIAIKSARIVVLLVSADFLDSDLIVKKVLPLLLAAAVNDEVEIISIILSPSRFTQIEGLARFQAARFASEPLIGLPKYKQEEMLVKVGSHILAILGQSSTDLSISSKSNQPRALNLPPPNPYFTGREEVLVRLYEAFKAGESRGIIQPQALNGLPGVGKTQTALQYAYKFGNEYQSVFWARAHSRETLIPDYVSIARTLQLYEKDLDNQNAIVKAVKSWIKQNSNWLLVLDYVEDLGMASEFIPGGGIGHVLLTTRTQNTGKIAVPNKVDIMTPQEGALFLLRRLNQINIDEPLDAASDGLRARAVELSEILGGLPLALDQAAAYIEEMSLSLEEYITLYGVEQYSFLDRRGPIIGDADHPESVAVTFSLSFKKIEAESQAAADLLRLCAFLDADAIPEEIFHEGREALGDTLGAAAANPIKLAEAIGAPARYSLLRRNPNQIDNIHRLAQIVIKDELDVDMQRLWAERAVRAVGKAFPIVAYLNWSSCERLIQQAKTLSKLIRDFNFAFPEAAEMLNRAGRYLKDRGLYNEAETILKQSLDIYEKATGDESQNSANVLLELAGICRIQGRYKEAEAQYKRCLTIREKALGVEHQEIAPVLNNLAIVYERQGKFNDAESLYNRSIEIYENASNLDGEELAAAHNNLAQLLQTLARFDEAEAQYKRALNLKMKVVGDENPGAAAILANLARLYGAQGRFAEAEPLYIRCLMVLEKVLGAEHLDVANTLTNFADTYRERERYEDAESLYVRALAIYEKTFGHAHPTLATAVNNLGMLYHSQDRHDLAEQYYKQSLNIHEEADSVDSIDYAATLNNLADIYYTKGSLSDAKPLYERSLIIMETTLGPRHPNVIEVKNSYSMLLDEIRSRDVF